MTKTIRTQPKHGKNVKGKAYSITILLNFHREGYIANSTILSALVAKDFFEKNRSECVEVVAVLDRPDPITTQVVQRFRSNFDVVEIVSYGDLAASRNHGIKRSNGDFIAFLDGDDLWGKEWLVRAFDDAQAVNGRRTVFHTEFFVSFGRENFARVQWDSTDPLFDPLTLMQNWHFCNNAFASRQLLLENPFVSYDHSSGFGSEDWHWSCETIGRGIPHRPVAGTAYFYRMRSDEMMIGGDKHLGLGAKEGLLVRPSELFDPNNQFFSARSIQFADLVPSSHHGRIRQVRSAPKKLPENVLDQWRGAGMIEPDCFLTEARLSTLNIFYPEIHSTLAKLYRQIMSRLKGVKRLVLLEDTHDEGVILAINRVLAGISGQGDMLAFLVMSRTSHTESYVQGHVFVPFWQLCGDMGLSANERSTLLTRIILQLQPAEIVNLWSSFFSEAVHNKYTRAFESLDIKILNFVHGSDVSDLFDNRFREQVMRALPALSPLSQCVATTKHSVNFIARRTLSRPGSVNLLASAGQIVEFREKPVGTASLIVDADGPMVSCILNVHREGSLLGPSLCSITDMIEYTAQKGVACELLAVLDRSDAQTAELVEVFARQFSACALRVLPVDFGDLSRSRNLGVGQACGQYVAFLDADDLYSRNWLLNALHAVRRAPSSEDVVIHPEFNIYFGKEQRIFRHERMDQHSPDKFGLAFTNFWTSLLFTTREMMIKHPLKPRDIERGYAFEDWSWNQEVLAAGISHEVAADTAHFIRLKTHGSLNMISVNSGATYHPSGLFSLEKA